MRESFPGDGRDGRRQGVSATRSRSSLKVNGTDMSCSSLILVRALGSPSFRAHLFLGIQICETEIPAISMTHFFFLSAAEGRDGSSSPHPWLDFYNNGSNLTS